MNRVTMTSRVGDDGVLRLAVPLGASDANRDVQVTIQPANPPTMTQQEWSEWVTSMAGSIADPTFKRHEQGAYERREPLP